MTLRIEARESVGYRQLWLIRKGNSPIDITDWVFKATFERQAGTPDFTLNMAASPSSADEGFSIFNGPIGQLQVNILPGTLQDIDDTTGKFVLQSDLLATPPSLPRIFIDAIEATIIQGPTA